MPDHRTTQVAELASRFVTNRDNFANRYRLRSSGLIGLSAGGPLTFSDLVNAHAAELDELLPPMTVAQWEGLSELTAARLNELRRIMAADAGKV